VLGLNVESLPKVASSELFHPPEIQATNIMCLEYRKDTARHIRRHFQAIGNKVEYSFPCTALHRFQHCLKVQIERPKSHTLFVYNNVPDSVIEVQIVCYSKQCNSLDVSLCQQVKDVVRGYLESVLGNQTSFPLSVRCRKSVMGRRGGRYDLESLQSLVNQDETQTCLHSPETDNHTLNPACMLMYWADSRMVG